MGKTENIGDTSFRRRKCGGWIAHYRADSLRLGAVGADRDEVERRLWEAVERWRRVLAIPVSGSE